MQIKRSNLDEIYSLSSKLTGKEFMGRVPDSEKLYATLNSAINRYIDPYTGKVNSDYSIYRDKCPLCDEKNYRFLFMKDGFDHMICDSCDLIFTLQLLDNEKCQFLEEGLEGDSYGEYKEKPLVNELDRKKFDIVYDQLEQFGSTKTIFDFGSQAGTFLDYCTKKGSKIIGHEYHTPLRKISERKGHIISNENLETISFDQEFDLITCWDYLDHVLNPKKVIQNLTKYLKKGGLFFFAVNNKDSISTKILHQYSANFIGPHHHMHYGIKQLKMLMKDYDLCHYETYVSELNQLSNWMAFKNVQFGDATLAFDIFDPKKLCEQGLGIKLNAIFKKK